VPGQFNHVAGASRRTHAAGRVWCTPLSNNQLPLATHTQPVEHGVRVFLKISNLNQSAYAQQREAKFPFPGPAKKMKQISKNCLEQLKISNPQKMQQKSLRKDAIGCHPSHANPIYNPNPNPNPTRNP
jgi:hypothetical protein